MNSAQQADMDDAITLALATGIMDYGVVEHYIRAFRNWEWRDKNGLWHCWSPLSDARDADILREWIRKLNWRYKIEWNGIACRCELEDGSGHAWAVTGESEYRSFAMAAIAAFGLKI